MNKTNLTQLNGLLETSDLMQWHEYEGDYADDATKLFNELTKEERKELYSGVNKRSAKWHILLFDVLSCSDDPNAEKDRFDIALSIVKNIYSNSEIKNLMDMPNTIVHPDKDSEFSLSDVYLNCVNILQKSPKKIPKEIKDFIVERRLKLLESYLGQSKNCIDSVCVLAQKDKKDLNLQSLYDEILKYKK